jgi:hypothetical protein
MGRTARTGRGWNARRAKILATLFMSLILFCATRAQAEHTAVRSPEIGEITATATPVAGTPTNARFVPAATAELWTAVDYTDDGWPPDINADGLISVVGDVLMCSGRIGETCTN